MTALLPRPARRARPSRMFGVFEALATPHGVDRYLELVHPMLTVRDIRATVIDVRHTATDSMTLTLRPTRRWRGFRAGQYVQVTVEIDGVLRTRCYSPCSSQHRPDGHFELTVKAHGGGLVSQWLHANARPGLVVRLEPAAGTFTLPEPRPERVVLISGGSGVTPVLAMLRTLCDEGYAGQVSFVHYARTPAAAALREEIEALGARHENVAVRFVHTSTDGHFAPEHVGVADADAQVYVCGPNRLMTEVREHFGDRVHSEAFRLTPVVTDVTTGGTLSFTESGTSTQNSGATLLEQAEAAGLAPASGCRMGICFSCVQTKASGCTRDVRTGETNSDPDTEIQLCINVPVGDVALNL